MPAFFHELPRDGQVDHAVAVARGEVRDHLDFWMPALFTRLEVRADLVSARLCDGDASFSRWTALLHTIEQGRCMPILGPGLAEHLWGSPRELARRWSEPYQLHLATHQRDATWGQVAQYLAVQQRDRDFPRQDLARYLHRGAAEALRLRAADRGTDLDVAGGAD